MYPDEQDVAAQFEIGQAVATPLVMKRRSLRRVWLVVGLAVMAFGLSACTRISTGDGTWFWLQPEAQGNDLYGATCPDSTVCYAVGANGTILFANVTNGLLDYKAWGVAPNPTSAPLYGIACPSAGRCFAVGGKSSSATNSTILSYDGASWTALSSGNPNDLRSVACLSANQCFAVGIAGTILSYNGSTWQPVTSPTTQDLFGISCAGSNFCTAVGSPTSGTNPTILSYNGTGWSLVGNVPANSNKLNSVTCLSSSYCIAVGDNATVFNYDGTSWTSLSITTTSANLNTVVCLSITSCIAVGQGGQIVKYNGSVWSNLANFGITLNALICRDANGCYTAGSRGFTTYFATQSNSSTSEYYLLTSNNLNGISCFMDNNQEPCQVAADKNVFLSSSIFTSSQRADITWGPSNSNASQNTNFTGISCFNSSFCQAVGISGTIVARNQSWQVESSPVTSTLYGVNCLSTSACVAVGAYNPAVVTPTILLYNGSQWASITQTLTITTNLRSVSCANGTTFCVAVGDSGTVISSTDAGVNWAIAAGVPALSANLLSVSCPTASACVATTNDGRLLVFNGTGWTLKTTPVTVPLNGVSCTSATACYIVGNGGTALVWNGTTISQDNTGATFDLRAISCTTGSRCYAVGTGGFILGRTIYPDNPAPVITSLPPDPIIFNDTAGALAITGSGFITDSQVRFNGSFAYSTYISSTKINAYFAGPGMYSINVYNAPPAGGTSNTLTRTVYAKTRTDLAVNLDTTASSAVLTATVGITYTYPTVPTGTVSFYDSGNLLATLPVGQGATSFPVVFTATNLPQGFHSFSAQYSGAPYFLPSTSDAQTFCYGVSLRVGVATDDGSCGTLSQAIAGVNAATTPVTITFVPGLTTISLTNSLVPISNTNGLTVTVQGGCNNGVPGVRLVPAGTVITTGLTIGNRVLVSGLAVTGFNGYGVEMSGTGSTLSCSYIGVAPDGTIAGNSGGGVHLVGSHNSLGVAGPNSNTTGNVISGNGGLGILVEVGSKGNTAYGNRVGLVGTSRQRNTVGALRVLTGGQLYLASNNRVAG